MKSFSKICLTIFIILIAVIAAGNYFLREKEQTDSRLYRVEAQRIEHMINENGADSVDTDNFQHINAVVPVEAEEDLYGISSDYLIIRTESGLFRLEYTPENNKTDNTPFYVFNACGIIILMVFMGAMLFLRQKIIAPFIRLRDVPQELAKGNLSVPIKESKGKFFGKFTWGLDMLRENLEQSRERELELQKDKKTLLLSLSHDIKTPLSAIKLYSKALSKGLYTEKSKQEEIFQNIDRKAEEIEKYVNEIVHASSEDFLSLSVNNTEFYLSEPVEKIRTYYSEKMELARVNFSIDEYSDCILKGDSERIVEVLQNIIENALKYGDGGFIKISFSDEEDCQLISVSNSGCTLSESETGHIFDSFWRGSNSGSCKGSGLGLYICRQLMRKMDGEAFAEINGDIITVTAVIPK